MRWTLVLTMLAWPSMALAQAVDCNTAATQIDLNACAAMAYKAADADLNEAYAAAKQALQAMDGTGNSGSGGAAVLLRAQRTWISFRDQACEVEGYPVQGGSIAPLVVANCLERLTRQRASDLWDFVDGLDN